MEKRYKKCFSHSPGIFRFFLTYLKKKYNENNLYMTRASFCSLKNKNHELAIQLYQVKCVGVIINFFSSDTTKSSLGSLIIFPPPRRPTDVRHVTSSIFASLRFTRSDFLPWNRFCTRFMRPRLCDGHHLRVDKRKPRSILDGSRNKQVLWSF